jgi:glycosyltransferase involved in cell wall biosynthesis
MKVLHLSTFADIGGAAIAARRLCDGLRMEGHEAPMLVRTAGAVPAPGVHTLEAASTLTDASVHVALHTTYRELRAPGVDVLFSSDLPTTSIAGHSLVTDADVVNVHWVSGLLSAPALRAIQDLGKPVVWTLHDQAAFTGGCHYSGTCAAYASGCDRCPLLAPLAGHVPAAVLRHKQRWLDPSRISIVCPSEWLSSAARRSQLFQHAAVHTIPNSVPVRRYQEISRADARAALSLPQQATVVLIGSDHLDERRKGHADAIDALSLLATNPGLQAAFHRGEIICAAFGDGALPDDGLPVVRLGRLDGDSRMALAYRAADLFLLPSLEDNLPNTLLESVASGTPLVAYATGGIPDVVARAGCGLLAPKGDVSALSGALALLLDDEAARQRMSERGEAYARAHLALKVQAQAYLSLYEDLLDRHQSASRVSVLRPRRDDAAFGAELAASEAELFATVLDSPALAHWLVATLARDNASHQDLIAARGGEIGHLKAAAERSAHELSHVHDEWRIARESLHQAGEHLRDLAGQLAHERAERAFAQSVRTAERAALKRKSRHHMTDVVIFGAGEDGRRLWESLAACGPAHVVAFVDGSPRLQGRALLGLGVHGLDWLHRGDWDVVVVPDEPADASLRLIGAGIDPSRIVVAPTSGDEAALRAAMSLRFPDPLRPLIEAAVPRTVTRLGIFGTGSAAMKVWEAIAEIDTADAVWFADNDAARQGSTFLWLDVIAPTAIAARGCDAVVVGSMSRDPIRRQLLELGIDAQRIVTPDVSPAPDRIRTELLQWLHGVRPQEVSK